MEQRCTVLDLFPGIGSMSLAAKMAGFQLKAAVVRSGEKRIQQLYQRNF